MYFLIKGGLPRLVHKLFSIIVTMLYVSFMLDRRFLDKALHD